MRDKHYKIKNIRMAEDTWKALKEEKVKSAKSWNLFLKELLDKLKQ